MLHNYKVSSFLSNIYLLTSLLFLIYVFYRSEIIYEGLRDDFYFIYKLLAFFLIICAILSFFISIKIKFIISIFIFLSVSSIYFLETYFIFMDKKITKYGFISDKKKKEYFEKNQIKFDERSKLEIYEDNKKNNKDIVAKYSPGALLKENNLEIFPLSGISNKETIYCNENGFFSKYMSDRYGFNNDDDVWDNDQIEIMILGDSYAHGACVDKPDDLVSQLKKISGKNVITVGYEGNGPLLSFASFKEFSKGKKINKVIYIFNEDDDLNEIFREIENKILKKYLDDSSFSQDLTSKQSLVDEIMSNKLIEYYEKTLGNKNQKKEIEAKISISSEIKKFVFFSRFRSKIINEPINFDEKEFKSLEKIFQNYMNLSKKNDFDFYIVFMPKFERLINPFEINQISKIISLAKKFDIKYLDFNESVLKKNQKPLEFFPFQIKGKIDDLNSEGYKILAKEIYRMVY